MVLDAGAKSAGAAAPDPVVLPSVPMTSLGTIHPSRIELKADSGTLRNGQTAVLTATANTTVTGTGLSIEIFDETAGMLVAACTQGSRCAVGYTANSGIHNFAAFVTPPTAQRPDKAISLASNQVSVGWLNSAIQVSKKVVGQGQAVTLTASSTIDVRNSGRWLEIYDLTAGTRLTYCTRGTVCTTSFKQTTGGVHEIVGYVTGQPEAVSSPVYVTWLGVSLSATSIGPNTGGTVYLKATTNVDLTDTPWVVGVYDQQGHLVDHACKTGTACSVRGWMSTGVTPSYVAYIGALPPAPSTLGGKLVHAATSAAQLPLVDVQAKSDLIQPTHLLWGVDSCKAFTGDPSGHEVFWDVVRGFGTPNFWGRYLTDTVCPALSSTEVALAAQYHMGILPIYNDYNCSNVSYYETGRGYAVEATAAAARIGIPKGRLIVIDIEPPGAACPGAAAVDSGFIEGWFDGVTHAGYVPGYYGNGTAGSEFASAWCTAVASAPNIATGSDLWSFEPSLLGAYAKTGAPSYSPYDPGCAGNMEAWQYQIGSNSPDGDVDSDEALSTLPLWYP